MYSSLIAYLHNVYGAGSGVRVRRKPFENEHVYFFMIVITDDYGLIKETLIWKINYDAIFIMPSKWVAAFLIYQYEIN